LNVISRLPDALQPVLNTIVDTAKRLCAADRALFNVFWEGLYHLVATRGVPESVVEDVRSKPIEPSRGSPAGRALLEKRAVHIEDARTDPEFTLYDVNDASRARTILSVPLLRGDDVTGVISVGRLAATPFTQRQIDLVTTFANQAVIAISNVDLFDQVQARNRDLTALGEVGRVVSSTLDLKVVLKTIVDRAVDLSGTDAGSIFYYREEFARFELGETASLAPELVEGFRKLDISASESGLGEVIAKRKPLQIPDLIQRPSEPLRDAVVEAGFRASLIVPLLSSERPLGALVLRRRRPGEFSPAVVSLIESFADQSAIALENARLFEEIARRTAICAFSRSQARGSSAPT